MSYENYDPSFPDQPVIDLYLPIWAKLPAFKSKPAFIWFSDGSNKHSTLTYSQLNESVQRIASELQLKFQRGDTVVILCPPGLELVEFIFGCQRAGLLCIPMFPPHPSFTNQNYHHLVRVLSQAKPKAAIANHDYITSVQNFIFSNRNHMLSELLQKLSWMPTKDIKHQNNNCNLITTCKPSYSGCGPEDVYLIQYTSGATGIPKPVLVKAGSAVHNVRVARKAYDLHPNSVIASWLPQYHDCGLQFLLLTIVSGATSVLTSPVEFVKRPRIWLDLVSEFKATCTPVPSFTLPLVVKRGGVDKGSKVINLCSMKNLIIINEPIYKASVDEFVNVFKHFGLNPCCISPSYGLAENCTFVSTSWTPTSTSFPSYKKLLPSARLAFQNEEHDQDMNIVVVNEDTHEPVEDGIEGEIWVSSPSNCLGYLGHPSLTRETFQARLSHKLASCFVRTGDRGVIKGEERYLYVTGRCSDMMKLGNGQEVHPHYIETAAYNSCPDFLRGGCLAGFEINGKIVVVAEMQKSDEKDLKLMRQVCERVKRSVVEEEGVEIGLMVLVKSGCVPKTTSGKIQRWATKDKLVREQLNIAMGVKFDKCDSIPTSFCANAGRREGEASEQKMFSFSSSSNGPSLLSLL